MRSRPFSRPPCTSLFPIGCDEVAQYVCQLDASVGDHAVFSNFTDEGISAMAHPQALYIRNQKMEMTDADSFFFLNPQGQTRVVSLTMGSFPKKANTTSLNSVLAELKQCPGQTMFVFPKSASNEGCEWTMATLQEPRDSSSSSRTLELVYVELKDRRNTRIDEIAKKVSAVTCDTWACDSEIVQFCTKEKLTVRQLLVIAGRCNDTFDVVMGSDTWVKGIRSFSCRNNGPSHHNPRQAMQEATERRHLQQGRYRMDQCHHPTMFAQQR